MNRWIDFKKLRKELNFAEVLRYYKVQLKLGGDQHHGFCPLPSHNRKRNSASFSANIKKGIWQCFGCGQKGNVIDFAVLMSGADPANGEEVRKVALKLEEQFSRTSEATKPEEKKEHDEKEKTVVNAPLDFALKGLEPKHPYLLNRGLMPETIARFGLGYCSRGKLKGRIAIPLKDDGGTLIGYAGRVIDDSAIAEENPKYRFPGRRERDGVIHEFRKSLFLYNAHHIVSPVDDLIIVEGFSTVWGVWQAGLVNVVATMGASSSGEQASIIVSLVTPAGRVWVFADGDEAGHRCAESVLMQVAPHRFTRWVQIESGKQPTDYSPAELKDCFSF